MLTIILAFLSANSTLFTTLGVLIFGGITAIISGNKQKAYTKLYGLCVEAESLEGNSTDKFNYVLNKAYGVLPIIIKTFVSEDAIRYGIEFALTNLKKFSALKMGVTEVVAQAYQIKEVSEVQKVENTVKKVIEEGKTEVEKLAEDVRDVVTGLKKVTPNEAINTGEKVVEDVTEGKTTDKIVEDVKTELPDLTKAVENIVGDSKPLIENLVEATGEINTEVKEIPVLDKIVTPIENNIVRKVEDVEKVVEEKIAEVKTDEVKIEGIAEPIIPIVQEVSSLKGLNLPIDVQENINKLEEILNNLKNSALPKA